jgi:hypothetical protein
MKKRSWTPERTAKFQATMAAKRAQRAAPKGVVPLHDLVPGGSKHGPRARTMASIGQRQPPIVVTFGKVKITIEVGE